MSLIPPHYLNSVVSIEIEGKDELGKPKKLSVATGFLIGKATGDVTAEGPQYIPFLVTNRHVFFDKRNQKNVPEVFLRFNTLDDSSHYFKVPLLNKDGIPIWHKHQDDRVDLAVLPINASTIKESNIEYYFFQDHDLLNARDFHAQNISTGDGLFVLGFPMSISGKTKNYVIVRQGIIARVDKEVLEDGFFYIDASAYPGNSGGPVIHKPEIISIHGTVSNSNAGLMGVISKGETYNDVAVSQQTGEPKIVFAEQTGLVRVVPVERIFEIIENIPKSQAKEAAKVQDVGQDEVEKNPSPNKGNE